MLDLLLGDLTTTLIWIGGGIAAVLGVYLKGRGDGREKMNRELDEAYIETRERIDETPIFKDESAARDFLTERLQSRNE
jgi:hypothetical protein